MAYQHEWEKSDLLAISRGVVNGFSVVHKFGASVDIGTNLSPVSGGTVYRTPTSSVSLEAISDNAGDSSAGAGARELIIQYLNSAFEYATAPMTMAGASASSTVPDVMRLTRAYVSKSGSYASQSLASQFGNISIRESGGGIQWALIPTLANSFGAGQSLIGAYTIPAGKTGYILSKTINVDSNKAVDFYFFKRENIDTVSAPYSAMRIQNIFVGVKNSMEIIHLTNQAYPEKTDIGFLAKASVSGGVSVEFELVLQDN